MLNEEKSILAVCSSGKRLESNAVRAPLFAMFLLIVSPSCMAASGGGLGGVFAAIFAIGFFAYLGFTIIDDWGKRRTNNEPPEKVGGVSGFLSNFPVYSLFSLFLCWPILLLYRFIGIGDTPLQTFFLSWITAIAGVYFFRHT